MDGKEYNQKAEELKTIVDDDNITLEQKISACEEIVFSDYCKENNLLNCLDYLLDLYNKAGRYQDIINFVMFDFKNRFKDNERGDAETNWFVLIASLYPSYSFRVVDAEIALQNYKMAKEILSALKENRYEMLNMHQNSGLRGECVFWYSHVLAKYAQIAILEGDASTACDYLNDSFWKEYNAISLESVYYTAKVWSGKVSPDYKDEISVELYEQVAKADYTSEKWGEDEKKMIVDSNYQLGLLYSTDPSHIDKSKAKKYLEKARELGQPISDEEITELIEFVPQTPAKANNTTAQNNNSNSGGGCYVATCVYGSYDCPEVWTLRRFRDNVLSKTFFGRLFIKLYYATSPTAVKLFGNQAWFHRCFKAPLDKLVEKLRSNGVDDTPYVDR